MGILEILTIVFVVLKLIGTIDWSWWAVLSPLMVSVTLYIVMIVGSVVFQVSVWKRLK